MPVFSASNVSPAETSYVCEEIKNKLTLRGFIINKGTDCLDLPCREKTLEKNSNLLVYGTISHNHLYFLDIKAESTGPFLTNRVFRADSFEQIIIMAAEWIGSLP